MKLVRGLLVLELLALAIGCGDKRTTLVDNDPAGIKVLRDHTYAEAFMVGDTGVQIRRVRLWQRNPESPFSSVTDGSAPDFDLLTAEIWFSLAGESQERYKKISGLRQDSEGWLFPNESLGGIPDHRANSNPYANYQRTAAKGFVAIETPALLEYERATNIILDASRDIAQTQVIGRVRLSLGEEQLPEGFAGVRHLQYESGANLLGGADAHRVIWEENTKSADGKLQAFGTMGCVVETRNAGSSGNGSFNAPQRIFEKVELGEYIHDRDGNGSANPAGNAAGCESPRCGTFDGADAVGDDQVWIRRQEYFRLVGLKITDSVTVEIAKDQVSPFYLSRELPTSQRSGAPVMSGVERLVRRCNDAAAQNAVSIAAHQSLGLTDGGTLATYSILPSVGFRLIAPTTASGALANKVFATDLAQACDALPDSKSGSASLALSYSSVAHVAGQSSLGVTNCGIVPALDVPTAVPAEYAGKALGAVLDAYIVPGTWDGTVARHTGAALTGSTGDSGRPMFRTQHIAQATR
jgi:hypothetical protein